MFTRPELKPCPFCGSKDIAIEYYKETKDEFPYWQICCDHCGATTGKCFIEYEYIDKAFESYFSAAEKAINNWNKRAKE